jgi:hypothetical protein
LSTFAETGDAWIPRATNICRVERTAKERVVGKRDDARSDMVERYRLAMVVIVWGKSTIYSPGLLTNRNQSDRRLMN